MYKKGILKHNSSSPHAIGLVETPELSSLGVEYFFRMMTPKARQLARPYQLEEVTLLKQLLANKEEKHDNLIVVGAGAELICQKVIQKFLSMLQLSHSQNFLSQKIFDFWLNKTQKSLLLKKNYKMLKHTTSPQATLSMPTSSIFLLTLSTQSGILTD